MRTTIDKAGRVVVPKKIRDAMGLTAGTPIDIIYEDGRIVIEYEAPEYEVRRKNGIKVLHSEHARQPLTDEMIRETLEAVRDERAQRYYM